MLAVMSVCFPILGHPIPKACAISALLRTENEVPTFSWVASPASNDAKSDSVRPTDHLAQGPHDFVLAVQCTRCSTGGS